MIFFISLYILYKQFNIQACIIVILHILNIWRFDISKELIYFNHTKIIYDEYILPRNWAIKKF